MTYILLTRNPSNRKLIAIINDDESVAEFETEDAASEAAHNTTACIAWGYQALEIEG